METSRNYLDLLAEKGYDTYITEHTRRVGDSASIIDHLFVKTINNCINNKTVIYHSDITDNFPILSRICVGRKAENVRSRERTISRINTKNLKEVADFREVENILGDLDCTIESLIRKYVTIYQNKINQVGQSSNKQIWNAVGVILAANSQKTKIERIRTEEKTIVTKPIEMAQELNRYFATVESTLAKEITQCKNYTPVLKPQHGI